MNEEMNKEVELTQDEEEEIERYDGDLNPVSLVLTAVVGSLSVVGGVTVGKKIYEKALKPGFCRIKCAISEKISEAKAKKAQTAEELEVVEEDDEE